MHRTKLVAFAVAAASLVAAVTVALGTANASTWHDYRGDVYPGHAYALDVPAGAKSYEILLSGGADATAHVAAYDPAGARLGHYALSDGLRSASVVSPAAGRHVVYVYDVANGALALRVDAASEPALDLAKVPLAREDVEIGESSAPARLDKAFTATLRAPPVFATLLYEGSATDLNADVASAAGSVVAIAHETGTAYSPGVWGGLSGTRTLTPENLDGATYTLTVHAASFEGTMFLTTLALDLDAPGKPTPFAPPEPPTSPVPPAPPSPPREPTAPAARPAAGGFALPPGKPIAILAQKGQLFLEAPRASDRANGSSYYDTEAISVYAPDDRLLRYVTLDARHRSVTVDLPGAGEYVAYVHAPGRTVVARVAGGSEPATFRELGLAKVSTAYDATPSLFGLDGAEPRTLTLAQAPVALKLSLSPDAVSVLGSARVLNENGVVASVDSLVQAFGADFFAYGHEDPQRFAAGEHTLEVDGLTQGTLTLTAVTYTR